MKPKGWIGDQRGVNLIELMAVVAVVAIVTAIAVPTYISYLPFLKVRSAARDLMSDLRYTRQQAVSVNKDHRLIFSSATQYAIQQEDSGDWATFHPIKAVDFASNYSEVTRTSATTTVYFKPNGGLDEVKHGIISDAAPFVLTLTHGGTGEARTIKLNGVGRVWTE